MHLPIVILTLVICCHRVSTQYADFRCKCICPSPTVVTDDLHLTPSPLSLNDQSKNVSTHSPTVNDSNGPSERTSRSQRSLYIANVHPQRCNCEWVVLPQVMQNFNVRAKEFCPLCECKYESRNITTIRWIVTLSVGIIVCLIIYMGYFINERSLRAVCRV